MSKEKIISRCSGVKKVPWVIADHAFLVIILSVFISFIFSGLIFYKYFVLDQERIVVSQDNARFNSGSYQRISVKWATKEQLILETSQNTYPDPFKLKAEVTKKSI